MSRLKSAAGTTIAIPPTMPPLIPAVTLKVSTGSSLRWFASIGSCSLRGAGARDLDLIRFEPEPERDVRAAAPRRTIQRRIATSKHQAQQADHPVGHHARNHQRNAEREHHRPRRRRRKSTLSASDRVLDRARMRSSTRRSCIVLLPSRTYLPRYIDHREHHHPHRIDKVPVEREHLELL